jgi:hypothetical protein
MSHARAIVKTVQIQGGGDMGERDDYNSAFRNERFGFGAGAPTTLAGALGQMAGRQQREARERPSQGAGLGGLIVEMARGGWIARGVLILIVGFALMIGGANAARGSWVVAVGLGGGSLLTALGAGSIVIGLLRRAIRALRRGSAAYPGGN